MSNKIYFSQYVIFRLLATVLLLLNIAESRAQRKISYVDPMIGSGGHGHVFVGASVPFGAVQLGPNNIYKGWDWCSGYHYSDSVTVGFSHTHLSGTGGSDLGDILIMPFTGSKKVKMGTQENPHLGFASYYSHTEEVVKPGYYAVRLKSHKINVELTATERVGIHKYSFPAGKQAHVMVDLKDGNNDKTTDAYIAQSDEYTLVGYRFSEGWANDQRLYFAIRSSLPLDDFIVYNDTVSLDLNSGKGKGIKGLISFRKSPRVLQLKVGISPVSSENALLNIENEAPGWDFDHTVKKAQEKWEKELSKIEIETKNENDKKIFYTSLYHTMIDPSIFNDHNGDYRGTDKKIYTNPGFTNYTVFSLWDTYRALQPLFTIFQPERENDIINSMLAIYQQQKRLPIWHLQGCETELMPGISGVQVVAEAYLKGFRGFDPKLAYESVKSSADRNELGLNYAKNLLYIPSDKVPESVAKAMEYSISDASIALMAKKLGNIDDAAYFSKRAKNYRHYFDPVSGFFRGKMASGSWNPVFNPSKFSHPFIDDYTEGNAWQYLWLVPHDVEGLVGMLGGEAKFNSRLDSLFALKVEPDPKMPLDITGLLGQYVHGDEPSHHIAYLYSYSGQQYKTAEKVRYLLKNMYQSTVSGISGNEDCGQMSAWYIFSALGFYPVFPANGAYVFGSPIFDKSTINLPGGKKFIVRVIGNNEQNIYIQSMELNGKKYDNSYLMHQDIVNGGEIVIRMGEKPNLKFGSTIASRPKSVVE